MNDAKLKTSGRLPLWASALAAASRLRCLVTVALSCAALAGWADSPLRTISLTGFREIEGRFGRGEEFPGAKLKTSLREEGGVRFLRMEYDLTDGGHYVGWNLPMEVTAGTKTVRLSVRTVDKASLYVWFRMVVDGRAEFGYKWAEPGKWNELEYTPHFKKGGIFFGIEPKGDAQKKGHLDIRLAECDTTDVQMKGWQTFLNNPSPIAIYGPQTKIPLVCYAENREKGAELPVAGIHLHFRDWMNRTICEKDVGLPERLVAFSPEDLRNTFGTMSVEATAVMKDGSSVSMGDAWFLRMLSDEIKPCTWVGTVMHGWGWTDRYRILAKVGIGTVRNEIFWGTCEKQKGVYTEPQTFKDDLALLKKLGISSNFVLDYGNEIYEDPMDPQAFGNWVEHIATTYRDYIDVFEVWNEGYTFGFHKRYGGRWTSEFTKFSRIIAERLHKCRPDATVVVCAEDGWHGLTRMLVEGIAKKGECISFHPYIHSQDPHPEHLDFFFADSGAEMREIARDNGGADRFRITEVGWSSSLAVNGEVEYLAEIGGYPPVTYAEQAQYLIRAFLIARMNGVESTMQYDFSDDGRNRHHCENNFGIVFNDLMPKPALGAIAAMTRLVGYAKPVKDLTVKPDRARVYLLERPDGKKVLVGWAVVQTRKFTLPAEVPAEYSLFDLQGNSRQATARTLELTEQPVYIVY